MSNKHMLDCEARYWRQWIKQNGREKWSDAKQRIAKHRGEDGLKRLTDKMNEQRNQDRAAK